MSARLALCMIVKNEEQMLPACLASVRDTVDEIIVVDTGSTDRTVAIAVEAGARVVHFQWRDDFAAARNAALPACTADWILVLDADERLAPGSGQKIRAAIANPDFDMWMLPLLTAATLDASPDEIVDGRRRFGEAVLLPRLMRRTPDLEWRMVVHENVSHWMAARIGRITGLDAPILHYGAVPSVRQARAKSHRNIQLLWKRAEANPQDPTPLVFLSGEYVGAGQLDDARKVIDRAWDLMRDFPNMAEPKPSFVECASQKCQFLLREDRVDDAVAVVDTALGWGSNHPNLHFLRARCFERKAELATSPAARRACYVEAVRGYKRCLDLATLVFPEETLAHITGFVGWLRLGRVALAMGEPKTAFEILATALQREPNRIELELARSESLIACGDAHAALRVVEPMLDKDGRPDAWVLAATVCDDVGALDDMAVFVREASSRVPNGFLDPARAEQLVQLDDAMAFYAGKGQPSARPLGRLFALVRRLPLPRAAEVPFLPDHTPTRRVVRNLVRAGDAASLTPLLERRAEQLLPGIGEVVRAELGNAGITISDDGEPEPVVIVGAGGPAAAWLTERLRLHPSLSHAAPSADPLGPGRTLLFHNDGRTVLNVTSTSRSLREWAAELPAARFVHLVQDARTFAATQEAPEPSLRHWANTIRQVRADATPIGDRYVEVRYEALLNDAEREFRRLLAFLGESWSDRVLGASTPPVATRPLDLPIAPDAALLLEDLGYVSAVREAAP